MSFAISVPVATRSARAGSAASRAGWALAGLGGDTSCSYWPTTRNSTHPRLLSGSLLRCRDRSLTMAASRSWPHGSARCAGSRRAAASSLPSIRLPPRTTGGICRIARLPPGDYLVLVCSISDEDSLLHPTRFYGSAPSSVDLSRQPICVDAHGQYLAHAQRQNISDRVDTMTSIPPGEYDVVAIAEETFPGWQDPKRLAELASRATRVRIADGQTLVRDLTTVRNP